MSFKRVISAVTAGVMLFASMGLSAAADGTGTDDTAAGASMTISAEVSENGYAYVGELQNVSEIESATVSFSDVTNSGSVTGNNMAWSTEKNENVTGDDYNGYFESNVFLAWSGSREANTEYAAKLPSSGDSNNSIYLYVWSAAGCTVTVNVTYKKTEINYISAEAIDGKLNYSVGYELIEEGTLYTALYKDGVLEDIREDQPEGSFEAEDGVYTIKAFLWGANQRPLCDAAERTVTVENGDTEVGEVLWRSTTDSERWVDEGIVTTQEWDKDTEEMDANNEKYIIVDQNVRYQTLDERPWGGCFNERGWAAMSELTDEQKEEVIRNLFTEDGLNLSIGRTAMAASDYAIEPYSYNENDGDYDMSEFSIEQDYENLIPYIKMAMEVRGEDFPIWASPWSPPSWMKTNGSLINGGSLKEDDEFYKAYALYFAKYVEAYQNEGINIIAVAPQNEPTMTTAYASCVWTGEQLNRFIRDYLRPTLDENGFEDIDIYLGTFTDANPDLAMPAIEDEVTREIIDGVCFQWWSASLAKKLYRDENNTDLKFIQSETKCGDGNNNWSYAEAQFSCFQEFFEAGVSQYFLWNMILDEQGRNTAYSWRQNAPINVHSETNEVIYTPHYYLVKHFTNYIDGGAGRIKTSGNFVDMIAFQNPDGENVLEVKNSADTEVKVAINFNGKMIEPTLKPHSINTFTTAGTVTTTEDSTFDESGTVEEDPVQVKLENKQSGLLLTVEGASFQDSARIIQSTNIGEAHQIWELVDKGDNYCTLASVNGYKVAQVWGTSTGEGLVQWGDELAQRQHWSFVPVTDEESGETYYAIVNRISGKVIAMPSSAEGAQAQQQIYTGADNQLWKPIFIMGESNFKVSDIELEGLGSELSTADDVKAALGAGGEFTLTDDITLDNAGVNAGVSVTGVIDGKGKTITKAENDTKNALLFQNGDSSWTFKDLTLDGNKENISFSDACLWYMAGDVTFEDVTVTNFKGTKETRFAMTNNGADITLDNVRFTDNENEAQTAFESNPGINVLSGSLTLKGATEANIYYCGGSIDTSGLTNGCEVMIKADTAENYANISSLACNDASVNVTADEQALTITFASGDTPSEEPSEIPSEEPSEEPGDTPSDSPSEEPADDALPIAEAADLTSAFADGGEYGITASFELANAGVDGGVTTEGVIDGNGFTVTKENADAGNAMLYQNGEASWTFRNITFDGNKSNITFTDACMWYGAGSAVFENVKFTNFRSSKATRYAMTISGAAITLDNSVFEENENEAQTEFESNPGVNVLKGSLKLKGATKANVYYCGGTIDVSELSAGCEVVIKADTEENYSIISELLCNDENVVVSKDDASFTVTYSSEEE